MQNKLLDYAPTGLAKLAVIVDILESSHDFKLNLIQCILDEQSIQEFKEAMK